jgi:hypothetical protein
MRPKIIILCAVIALVTWLAALFAAISIPGSPFNEAFGVVERVADPRIDPAVFDQFLALGQRTRIIAAIVFPLAAGVAVALLSRFRVRLSWREALAVVILFSAFIFAWSGGIGYFGVADAASIVIFMLILALGVTWRRDPTAV